MIVSSAVLNRLKKGFRNLAKLGIRTVIDLRIGHEYRRAEEAFVKAACMYYVHVPLNRFGAPKDEQIVTLLSLLDDNSSGWPMFVHCKLRADQTDTVAACYRIMDDHWPNERALREAKLYSMSALELAMRRFILHFGTSLERRARKPSSGCTFVAPLRFSYALIKAR
jgi:protein tyrosine/serine phosphatase